MSFAGRVSFAHSGFTGRAAETRDFSSDLGRKQTIIYPFWDSSTGHIRVWSTQNFGVIGMPRRPKSWLSVETEDALFERKGIRSVSGRA